MRRKYLRASALLFALAAIGCGKARQREEPAPQATPKFVVAGSVLYRDDANGRLALLSLDSAAAPPHAAIAPSEWTPAPGSTFGVAAKSFRHVVAAPDAEWVAWETSGAVHDLLGVVPGRGGKLTVLDFFFDSSARELSWAPAGRFLMAFYLPPSGMTDVRVYDARTGARLPTPWTKECRAEDGCDTTSAQWVGPSTLAIKTTARAYQTDVSRL